MLFIDELVEKEDGPNAVCHLLSASLFCNRSLPKVENTFPLVFDREDELLKFEMV